MSPLSLVLFWAFATRRAFRYIFARFCFLLAQKFRCLLSVVCCPKMLAKDAAPIPNATPIIKIQNLKISELQNFEFLSF